MTQTLLAEKFPFRISIINRRNKYYAIVHPFRNIIWSTKKNVFKAIVKVWLLSTLLSAPELAFSDLHYTFRPFTNCTYFTNVTNITNITNFMNFTESYAFCNPTFTFAAYQLVTIFVIPMIVLTYCYSHAIYILWLRSAEFTSGGSGSAYKRPELRRLDPSLVPSDDEERESQERMTEGTNDRASRQRQVQVEKKVIRMLIMVVALFLFGWGPRLLMDVLQTWILPVDDFTVFNFDLSEAKDNILDILIYFHCCINPFIYYFTTNEFSGKGGCLEKIGFKRFPPNSECTSSKQTQHSRVQSHGSNYYSRRHDSPISIRNKNGIRNTKL